MYVLWVEMPNSGAGSTACGVRGEARQKGYVGGTAHWTPAHRTGVGRDPRNYKSPSSL